MQLLIAPLATIGLSVAGGVLLLVAVSSLAKWTASVAVTRAAADASLAGAVDVVPARAPGGQRSVGLAVGGTGVLAVLPDEVRFVLATPRRSLAIPRAAITSATVERTLRVPGRYQRGGAPFVVLRWTTADGERVAGFQLREGERVLAALAASARP